MYMSFHTRVILPAFAVLSLAFLIGCGSSSHHTPPPSGGFTKANLSGTYVFNIVGSDNAGIYANIEFQAITGTFSADGNGNIGSSGAVDFANSVGDSAGTPITGGSYTVSPDGRGQATLTTTNPVGIASNLILDFVLSSSSGASGGLVTQFDGNGTGSGTLALQVSSAPPAAGNYVVALTGVLGPGQLPVSYAGAIAIDANGNVTGSLDYQQGGNAQTCTIAAGSSVATLPAPVNFTGLPCTSGNLLIDAYAVSGNDVKLISSSPNVYPIFSGDLFSQSSTSFPSGQLVFTMSGLDSTPNASGPTAMAGLMTSDGSSTLSAGEEDFNDVGFSNDSSSGTPFNAFTGTINNSPSGSSRYLVNLSNFVNVGGGPLAWGFAAYPTDNGVVLIEVDSTGGTAVGMAFAQSSTALASGTGYGMNLSGFNGGGFEEDDIAEFTTTTSGFSGGIDMNDQTAGNLLTDGNFTGNYGGLDPTATGRGLITATTPQSTINAAYYTVSSTQTVMVEVDQTQLGLGSLITQSGSSSSSLASNFAEQHMAVVRSAAKALKAKKEAEKK
jgi:hypothetical protein